MEKLGSSAFSKLCRREKVPFFFKQWGGVHKSTTGRLLNGRTYDEMPALSAANIPARKIRIFSPGMAE